MDSEATDLYLMKINELLQDEDKIVTFTFIASDFDVEIDNAKSLLSQYLSDQRGLRPEALAVTYIITGTLKDSNRLTVSLVKEEDLPKKKKDFAKISSEFIYSLQKSKNVDFNTITLIDELNVAKTIAGSVVGENCIKGELKVKKIEIAPKDCKPVTTKTASSGSKQSLFAQSTNSEKLEKPSTSKESSQSNQQPKPSQTKSKSAGGITSFFSKVPAKTEADSNKREGKLEDNIDTKGKNDGRPKDEMEERKPKDKNEEGKSKDKKEEKSDNNNKNKEATNGKPSPLHENEEMEMDVEDIIESTPKKAEESKPSKKRKKGNKEKEQQSKKRKRIQQICDSDSDDNMFGENGENKLIEKSDEEESPTFIKAPLAPKNKVRKAVDVTYEDDEGFIITKTEYVYEDPPEDEVKIEEPVAKPKILEKKSSPNETNNGVKSKGKKNAKKPATGKQPTLMSFFKKA